jgi:type I restriction enzyme S subunit
MSEVKMIPLRDADVFDSRAGLWTGKRPPFVRAKVLRNTDFGPHGALTLDDAAELDVEQRHFSAKSLVRGDILVEKSGGGPNQPVGRVAYFDGPSDAFAFSNFTSRLRVLDLDAFLPKYVFYYLLHFYNQGGTESLQQHTTGLRNLDYRHYLDTEIPRVSLSRQREIVRVLADVQSALANEHRRIGELDMLRQAMLREIFGDADNDPGQRFSFEERVLTTVADLYSGGTPSKARSDYWEGDIPWASPKDMKRPRLVDTIDHISSVAAQSGSRLVPAGSIFVVIRGMILARDIPLCIATREMAFNQDMKAIVARSGVSPDYLYYALLARKSDLLRAISTSAHGTRRISSSAVEDLVVPIPVDEADQERIASTLRALDERRLLSQQAAARLAELFEALLNDVMKIDRSTNA